MPKNMDKLKPLQYPEDCHDRNAAFAKILPEINLCERRVKKKIAWIIKDTNASTDVWQEVLLKTWQHAAQLFTEEYGEEGREDWIYKLVHNEAINYARARDNRKRGSGQIVSLTPLESSICDRSLTPEDIVIENDLYDKGLQILSKKRKEVIVRFIAGYDYKEIAEALGMTENAVGLHIYKARKTITGKAA